MTVLPVEVSDVVLVCSSLSEAASHCEDHHGVAVEGNIQGEGVQVVLCLGELVQERDNTQLPLLHHVVSPLLVLHAQQVPALLYVGGEQLVFTKC